MEQMVLNLGPDSQYLPRSTNLPESLLEHAAGPLAEPLDAAEVAAEWDDANGRAVYALNSLLPRARRIKHYRCWRYALHIRKTGVNGGTCEGIYGVSCGDRDTCLRCGPRTARDRYTDHFDRMLRFTTAAKCATDFVTITAAIPQWAADARIAGCAEAEAIGGRCLPKTGCPECAAAEKAHARMVAIERAVVAKLRALWLAASPNTCGIYDSKPVWTDLNGTPQIKFTIASPQIAMKLPDGADTGVRVPYTPVDMQKFGADFEAWLQAEYPGAQITGGCHKIVNPCPPERDWVFDPKVVTEEFRRALSDLHELPWMAFCRTFADAGGAVTEQQAQMFARVCGLAITTKSGKNRRHQRTGYFGFLGGNTRAVKILRGLNIDVITERPPPARTETIARYRVVNHLPDGNITVQNTKTGVVSVPDRALVKFHPDAAVDAEGRPAHARSRTRWIFQGEFVMGRWWKQQAHRAAAERHARIGAELAADGAPTDLAEFAKYIQGKLCREAGK